MPLYNTKMAQKLINAGILVILDSPSKCKLRKKENIKNKITPLPINALLFCYFKKDF